MVHYRKNAYQIIVKLIPISFMSSFGNETVNLANSEGACLQVNGTHLAFCPEMEKDIIECQEVYNKTITLSLGGSAYTGGEFSSVDVAIAAADKIWANFGPPCENSTSRLFGNASIDGFDFDFESSVNNTVPFANRLRSLMDDSTKKTGRQYYLTSAPQCSYPDKNFGPLLDSSVRFDRVMVQFYNNYCGASSFLPGNETQTTFNFAQWDNWAKTVSSNPDVKIMLGLIGGDLPPNTGFVSGDQLKSVINYAKGFSSFGGVMLWDMTVVYNNTDVFKTAMSALGRDTPRIEPVAIASQPEIIESSRKTSMSSKNWQNSEFWLFFLFGLLFVAV
ncbi:Bgt-1268 [Blumeria graminis f. sp. tritici]|uniref:chitinase n=2 Tax=Blumeria graminis f. sp. tritici TaxID=62690 RepID=A0A9X9QF01_BLUGR|nr:Endochitinase [Blumeria graminis f. sp. tritici 96224]VDB92475.1 Bgt-1268 [Blumeria graminis f. sp. tritici]